MIWKIILKLLILILKYLNINAKSPSFILLYKIKNVRNGKRNSNILQSSNNLNIPILCSFKDIRINLKTYLPFFFLNETRQQRSKNMYSRRRETGFTFPLSPDDKLFAIGQRTFTESRVQNEHLNCYGWRLGIRPCQFQWFCFNLHAHFAQYRYWLPFNRLSATADY